MSWHTTGNRRPDAARDRQLQTQPQTLTLPSKIKNIVLNNLPQLKADGNEITLEGYQAVVLEV